MKMCIIAPDKSIPQQLTLFDATSISPAPDDFLNQFSSAKEIRENGILLCLEKDFAEHIWGLYRR